MYIQNNFYIFWVSFHSKELGLPFHKIYLLLNVHTEYNLETNAYTSLTHLGGGGRGKEVEYIYIMNINLIQHI